jgi:hypothetical protein
MTASFPPSPVLGGAGPWCWAACGEWWRGSAGSDGKRRPVARVRMVGRRAARGGAGPRGQSALCRGARWHGVARRGGARLGTEVGRSLLPSPSLSPSLHLRHLSLSPPCRSAASRSFSSEGGSRSDHGAWG